MEPVKKEDKFAVNGEKVKMFVLSEMTDVVKVPPWMFHLKLNEAVEQELNKKFSNKVKNRDPKNK